jgi:thioredoxin reductase (NADPH)
MGLQLLGKEIFEAGIQQAKTLSIPINNEEVLSISYDNIFTVVTNKEKYEAKSVLLATGANRITPNIKGIKEFEGKGISYCAICDGFLYRGQDVAVLGNGQYAIHEAQELSNVVKSVTILTNGQSNTKILDKEKITTNEKKIVQFEGDSIIKKVKFEDETELPIRGIFIAEGVATSIDFARKLGAKTGQNKIIVNSKMETNVPGLYAAGDCTGGLLQIATAVAEGAIAGTEIIRFIRESKEGK